MVNQCRIILGDAGSLQPALIDRKTPAETIRIENDVSADVDCAGAGITITNSTWAIHPDDDDATLTLGTASFSGLVTNVPASGGTDARRYQLDNTIVTSDGQTIVRSVVLPVRETARPNA